MPGYAWFIIGTLAATSVFLLILFLFKKTTIVAGLTDEEKEQLLKLEQKKQEMVVKIEQEKVKQFQDLAVKLQSELKEANDYFDRLREKVDQDARDYFDRLRSGATSISEELDIALGKH